MKRSARDVDGNIVQSLLILMLVIALSPAACTNEADGTKPRRPNVLFISIDDLRPELGCYGAEQMHTPHIDQLAKQGLLFNRAYCQQAVCNPSRASLMTGLRPDSTRVYDLATHFRLKIPDVVTLPQYFKQHGYHTQAVSKIYHRGLDDPISWSVPHMRPKAPVYHDAETRRKIREQRRERQAKGLAVGREPDKEDPETGTVLQRGARSRGGRIYGPSREAPDVPDNALVDGKTADRIIELLDELEKGDKPFFLAAGFLKPHLPFVAPKRYFDLYPTESIELADNEFSPEGVPGIALHRSMELRIYPDIPDEWPLPDPVKRETIRAYRATVSFIDAQVGRILAELDRLGLRENTVVILWGDHGWHLGEHDLWGKMTNFEIATRVPLIISAPGQKHRGATTDALSEFVDISPTLFELCGLPVPDNLEGISLVPVLEDPGRDWKTAAFSQYPRPGYVPTAEQIQQMGYSMRTDRYRYTEWQNHETGAVMARELYDYETDPQGNLNVAGKPENRELVEQLSRRLARGWRGALPEN